MRHCLESIRGIKLPLRTVAALIFASVALSPVVQARKSKAIVAQAVEAYQSTNSTTVPAIGSVEVAFRPNEGSEHLVIKVIDSEKSELDRLSYSFTSIPVVEGVVRARHSGVKVTLVADSARRFFISLVKERENGMIDLLLKALDRLIDLARIVQKRKRARLDEVFAPAFNDLQIGHSDYLAMFAEVVLKVEKIPRGATADSPNAQKAIDFLTQR